MGFPGTVCSANLTPDPDTGLAAWTDGEILRAMREGVSRDGRALAPIMPYTDLKEMADPDAQAIVAYLRTLKPIKNALPRPEIKPPLNIIVKFLPRPLSGPVAPPAAEPVARGKYLTTIFGCRNCHTPVDEKHRPLPGKTFAGGQVFTFPPLSVTSANITPHATGLGDRTKENFVGLFRAFAAPEMKDVKIDPAKNTVMPWLTLAHLTDEDLGAIYDYLKTVPPVENSVPKLAPPTAAP
jgi:mono/diheme cytochrome c family protein